MGCGSPTGQSRTIPGRVHVTDRTKVLAGIDSTQRAESRRGVFDNTQTAAQHQVGLSHDSSNGDSGDRLGGHYRIWRECSVLSRIPDDAERPSGERRKDPNPPHGLSHRSRSDRASGQSENPSPRCLRARGRWLAMRQLSTGRRTHQPNVGVQALWSATRYVDRDVGVAGPAGHEAAARVARGETLRARKGSQGNGPSDLGTRWAPGALWGDCRGRGLLGQLANPAR